MKQTTTGISVSFFYIFSVSIKTLFTRKVYDFFFLKSSVISIDWWSDHLEDIFLCEKNFCLNHLLFQEMRETHRFQTLVNFFTNPQEFQIDFMVACMQFINIVVHSVEVGAVSIYKLNIGDIWTSTILILIFVNASTLQSCESACR